MRRLALAMAMACVLSGAARAGEIPSTGVAAPPPPCTVTATGEVVPTSCTPAPQESSTVLTIILTLITFVP
jgi:type 1 fimbria pilin